jgi:hypothetical protein
MSITNYEDFIKELDEIPKNSFENLIEGESFHIKKHNSEYSYNCHYNSDSGIQFQLSKGGKPFRLKTSNKKAITVTEDRIKKKKYIYTPLYRHSVYTLKKIATDYPTVTHFSTGLDSNHCDTAIMDVDEDKNNMRFTAEHYLKILDILKLPQPNTIIKKDNDPYSFQLHWYYEPIFEKKGDNYKDALNEKDIVMSESLRLPLVLQRSMNTFLEADKGFRGPAIRFPMLDCFKGFQLAEYKAHWNANKKTIASNGSIKLYDCLELNLEFFKLRHFQQYFNFFYKIFKTSNKQKKIEPKAIITYFESFLKTFPNIDKIPSTKELWEHGYVQTTFDSFESWDEMEEAAMYKNKTRDHNTPSSSSILNGVAIKNQAETLETPTPIASVANIHLEKTVPAPNAEKTSIRTQTLSLIGRNWWDNLENLTEAEQVRVIQKLMLENNLITAIKPQFKHKIMGLLNLHKKNVKDGKFIKLGKKEINLNTKVYQLFKHIANSKEAKRTKLNYSNNIIATCKSWIRAEKVYNLTQQECEKLLSLRKNKCQKRFVVYLNELTKKYNVAKIYH